MKTHLVFPASINFLPSGDLLILERTSHNTDTGEWSVPRLSSLNLGSGELTEIAKLTQAAINPVDAAETLNGGALGLALAADLAVSRRLFICYHYHGPGGTRSNRLSSFRLDGERLGAERVLVDRVAGSIDHNGCRVVQGPEGRLFYSTGDSGGAQDRKLLDGKILRLNADGSVPEDNPFPNSLVWSYGHRNPQGLAFDPATGRLWSTEHGAATNDELNVIERGMNYGWPRCGGEAKIGGRWGPRRPGWLRRLGLTRRVHECQLPDLEQPSYRPAVRSYYPDRALAISDMTFYTGDLFPAWQGDLFFVTLRTGRLMRVRLDGPTVIAEETLITGDESENYGRLRDVTVGPDGNLYVASEVRSSNPMHARRPPNPLGGLLLRISP